MNSTLSFCKFFKKSLKLVLLALVALPMLSKAQNLPNKLEVNRSLPISYPASWGNLRTAASATCPTNPVTLAGQDTLGNAVANGHTFACNTSPFFVYVPIVSG